MAETIDTIVRERIDGTVGLVNALALTHYVMGRLDLHGATTQQEVHDDVLRAVKAHEAYGIDVCLTEDDVECEIPRDVQWLRILKSEVLNYLSARYGEDEYDFADMLETIAANLNHTLTDDEKKLIITHAEDIIRNNDHHPDAVRLQHQLEEYQDA